jgi:hypothetical protein
MSPLGLGPVREGQVVSHEIGKLRRVLGRDLENYDDVLRKRLRRSREDIESVGVSTNAIFN